MTDVSSSPAAAGPPTTDATLVSGEKTAWWITFGVLTIALVTMLGLWD
ncbi:hypothetical protein [Actinotalea ferrariae]|nr:hypothetical protein [Actinotalea ferrariae]